MRHVPVELRWLERAENTRAVKTSPWRHPDIRGEVNVQHGLMHGTHASNIDLYSDQVFSPLRRGEGWVHLPAMAHLHKLFSVIFPSVSRRTFFPSHIQRSCKRRATEVSQRLDVSMATPAPAAMASLASSSTRISTSKRSEKPPTSCACAIAAVIGPTQRP